MGAASGITGRRKGSPDEYRRNMHMTLAPYPYRAIELPDLAIARKASTPAPPNRPIARGILALGVLTKFVLPPSGQSQDEASRINHQNFEASAPATQRAPYPSVIHGFTTHGSFILH